MSGNLINSRLPDKNWTPRRIIFTVLFTAISIGINYFGSFLAGLIAFPLYLDSVMTIAVTALCGLVPGLICAFGSNLLLFIFAHTGIFFSACHLSTALIAWLVFRAERKKAKTPGGVSANEKLLSADSFMWAGFLAAISNSIIGDTISTFVYGANTSIPQVDNAVQGIYVVIRSLPVAAYIGGTITNFVDKLVSATICLFIYRFVKKVFSDLPSF
ncbi:MAG: hypothetical protein PUI64_04615 [Treponema succinifaciens]|uniref:hypothetical protein n=1 Tax=Treponema succinifaciens TaxID=167 RepID=UPI0023EFB424|nr:hypothetical protein [Treponema succinifaciens]MDD6962167.1 hypothetical protein [Treponema succinifaciens]MDY5117109.1 hypothetical protein [Treponema succinifaciens]